MFKLPVNNKGCSSIQFRLSEFCQKYKNVLLSFFVRGVGGGGGPRKFLKVLKVRALAQKVAQVAAYNATYF